MTCQRLALPGSAVEHKVPATGGVYYAPLVFGPLTSAKGHFLI
jgi:hypothetical protein